MSDLPVVLGVRYTLTGGIYGDWNCELKTRKFEPFFGTCAIPQSDFELATIYLEQRQPGPMRELLTERWFRDSQIRVHFKEVSRKVIRELHEKDGLPENIEMQTRRWER